MGQRGKQQLQLCSPILTLRFFVGASIPIYSYAD
jgi:hypothetical protein